MKKSLFILSFFLFLLFFAGMYRIDDIKQEIKNELNKMSEYWNKGDLDKYMSFYANNNKTTFQSSTQRFYGFETIHSLFVGTFKNEDLRGTLSFSEQEVTVFSKEYAMVIGKFTVAYKNNTSREGYYTVIVRKFKNGWKIIHDHS